MKVTSKLLLAIFVLCGVAMAQDANPVVSAAKQMVDNMSKRVMGAAEAMPAGKYSLKPTPDHETFAHLIGHTAESSLRFCSKLNGTEAPAKPAETDAKEKQVAYLQSSFTICGEALGKLKDSELGQEMELYGGRKGTKASALFSITGGLQDHYAQMAGYLRAADVKPPTAK
jgi:uncharacterized damage-inducible protein DinB